MSAGRVSADKIKWSRGKNVRRAVSCGQNRVAEG
jgi:hypothetical protein